MNFLPPHLRQTTFPKGNQSAQGRSNGPFETGRDYMLGSLTVRTTKAPDSFRVAPASHRPCDPTDSLENRTSSLGTVQIESVGP